MSNTPVKVPPEIDSPHDQRWEMYTEYFREEGEIGEHEVITSLNLEIIADSGVFVTNYSTRNVGESSADYTMVHKGQMDLDNVTPDN